MFCDGGEITFVRFRKLFIWDKVRQRMYRRAFVTTYALTLSLRLLSVVLFKSLFTLTFSLISIPPLLDVGVPFPSVGIELWSCSSFINVWSVSISCSSLSFAKFSSVVLTSLLTIFANRTWSFYFLKSYSWKERCFLWTTHVKKHLFSYQPSHNTW